MLLEWLIVGLALAAALATWPGGCWPASQQQPGCSHRQPPAHPLLATMVLLPWLWALPALHAMPLQLQWSGPAWWCSCWAGRWPSWCCWPWARPLAWYHPWTGRNAWWPPCGRAWFPPHWLAAGRRATAPDGRKHVRLYPRTGLSGHGPLHLHRLGARPWAGSPLPGVGGQLAGGPLAHGLGRCRRHRHGLRRLRCLQARLALRPGQTVCTCAAKVNIPFLTARHAHDPRYRICTRHHRPGHCSPPAPVRLQAIAFDMDSTLINIECVDEIADAAGRRPRWPRSPKPPCKA